MRLLWVRFPSLKAAFALVICQQEIDWRATPSLTTVGKYAKQKWADRGLDPQQNFNQLLLGASLPISSFSSFSVSLCSGHRVVNPIKMRLSAVIALLSATWAGSAFQEEPQNCGSHLVVPFFQGWNPLFSLPIFCFSPGTSNSSFQTF